MTKEYDNTTNAGRYNFNSLPAKAEAEENKMAKEISVRKFLKLKFGENAGKVIYQTLRKAAITAVNEADYEGVPALIFNESGGVFACLSGLEEVDDTDELPEDWTPESDPDFNTDSDNAEEF